MVVVDASAVIAALSTQGANTLLMARLGGATELYAPQLLDIEILHALRRLVATGQLSPERAQEVREDCASLRIQRYPHEPLADRAWDLRDYLTPSDAIYVALAEVLEVPLVTCDRRFQTAHPRGPVVEIFA